MLFRSENPAEGTGEETQGDADPEVTGGEGIPPIISDGHAVTFRCVVKDELWTLNIRIPQNKALLLSEICEQILVDVKANEFNESKYFKSLDQLDF